LCPEMQPEYALCFEGQLSSELRASGVPVHMLGEVRFSRPWSVHRARRNLRALLRERKVDVALTHSCWPHALFAPVLRSERVPIILYAHDAYKGRHWSEKMAKRTPPDALIANSRYTHSSARALFSGIASEVIYCPVPASKVESDARRRIRQELNADASTTVIVIASRLEEWKGHRVLIESLKNLSNLGDWQCWIAGGVQKAKEQPYLDALQSSSAELVESGRLKFIGHRSDLPQVLAAADIYCQPNTAPEPFGIAFVEALHAGLATVTTGIGGVAEIVDESCGVVVKPNDVVALTAALRELIGNPDRRQKLALQGRRQAESLCDVSVIIPAIAKSLCARIRCASAP